MKERAPKKRDFVLHKFAGGGGGGGGGKGVADGETAEAPRPYVLLAILIGSVVIIGVFVTGQRFGAAAVAGPDVVVVTATPLPPTPDPRAVTFDSNQVGYWAPDGDAAVLPPGRYLPVARWGTRYVQLDNQVWIAAAAPPFDQVQLAALIADLPDASGGLDVAQALTATPEPAPPAPVMPAAPAAPRGQPAWAPAPPPPSKPMQYCFDAGGGQRCSTNPELAEQQAIEAAPPPPENPPPPPGSINMAATAAASPAPEVVPPPAQTIQ